MEARWLTRTPLRSWNLSPLSPARSAPLGRTPSCMVTEPSPQPHHCQRLAVNHPPHPHAILLGWITYQSAGQHKDSHPEPVRPPILSFPHPQGPAGLEKTPHSGRTPSREKGRSCAQDPRRKQSSDRLLRDPSRPYLPCPCARQTGQAAPAAGGALPRPWRQAPPARPVPSGSQAGPESWGAVLAC